jgi:dihydrofolate reductase
MAKLIYAAITSLDGFVADEHGNFDWAAPDEEVHQFVNDLERGVGTHLYGRRMYEVMRYWETAHEEPDQPEVFHDYTRIWQAADKVVYSRTLDRVSTSRTRLERQFDADAVRRLKAQADADLSVGGPHLAAEALRAGLVDEIQLFLTPHLIGRGNAALPDDVRMRLELIDERRFAGGVVYLAYRLTGPLA